MTIKFDLHAIGNAKGEGKEQKFVKPIMQDAMSLQEITDYVSHTCSLTPGDLAAAFAAISHLMGQELANGRRFHLPGLGYFSLRVKVGHHQNFEKLKGHYIFVSGMRFKPEASLLHKIQSQTSFERLEGTTRSQHYTVEELIDRVRTYLTRHPFITRKIMEEELHMRSTMARQWLKRLVDMGVIERMGTRNSPVYLLKEQ